MDFYDANIVTEITDSSTVGWEDAMPVLMIMGTALLLSGFVLLSMMREWAWLNQFNE
jgi:hypothetical protein